MKFSDFICVDAIRADLAASDKEGVIRELTGALVAAGKLAEEDLEGIVTAVMKREELGSTGIGRGVAVPHTKHPGVDELVGTVGISPGGVDFASLDGEPVQLFFLIVSPLDRPGDHLRALENISRRLRDEMFCKLLKQTTKTEDISALLEEADNNEFGN